MKKLILLVFVVASLGSAAQAEVTFTFSTDDVDPTAGNVLNVGSGESASIYVFVENNDSSGNIIDGLSLDVSSDSANLTATAFNIANPSGTRWLLGTSEGTLGSTPFLVDNSNAATLGGNGGIANGAGPILHAELVFTAGALGTASLGFAEGDNLISLQGQQPDSLVFGTATVSVVPEPGSASATAMLLAGGAGFLARRRSRRAKACLASVS